MTPAYVAPELLGNDGFEIQPTMASDIYSLGILAYEVILCMQPWKNVPLNLINKVKQGYRPTLPDSTPVVIAK